MNKMNKRINFKPFFKLFSRYINGVKYFATGDIGEMLPNGNLKIIDRKKDLVKLQGGEYVSLNKVESLIKLLPFVDNCCVIADSSKENCVCLVSPNLKVVCELILNFFKISDKEDSNSSSSDSSNSNNQSDNKKKKNEISSKLREDPVDVNYVFELLDNNKKILDNMNKELFEHCLKTGLSKFEIPTKLKLVKEAWLPDSGLVTDSLKLKRKEIEKFYQKEIKIFY
jgi:long-chain acyl-CoA synthetase